MTKKLLQLFYILPVAGLLPLAVTGCLFGFGQKPYVAVKYYDLATPPEIVLRNVQVTFMPFDSTEPVKYKMTYRNNNCEVVIDDYHKWIQTPCLLITRYLQGAFIQDGITPESPQFTIFGNVFMFRIDLQNNTVSLGVNYVIKTASGNIIRTVFSNSKIFSAKLENEGPDYFVAGLSKCAARLAFAINGDIKTIRQYEAKIKSKVPAVSLKKNSITK
ncbi:MAG: hypothetical protein PHH77_00570 [Victivallaceae bacterium]|nr:hypothetical protein [Victivallaceae bacterium]